MQTEAGLGVWGCCSGVLASHQGHRGRRLSRFDVFPDLKLAFANGDVDVLPLRRTRWSPLVSDFPVGYFGWTRARGHVLGVEVRHLRHRILELEEPRGALEGHLSPDLVVMVPAHDVAK